MKLFELFKLLPPDPRQETDKNNDSVFPLGGLGQPFPGVWGTKPHFLWILPFLAIFPASEVSGIYSGDIRDGLENLVL